MGFSYLFRRRKRHEDALAGYIMDHHHSGGKEHEKMPLAGSSAHSTRSTMPLRGTPVHDGSPGSGAHVYVRLHGSSACLQSPDLSVGGVLLAGRNNSSERHHLTDREELEAARLNSPPLPSGIVSYGPNPATPTITPRPSTRFHDNPSSGSDNSFEGYYAPSKQHITPPPQSQSPLKAAGAPLVVSYGPNRITPTPTITTTTPRDESVTDGAPALPEFPLLTLPSQPFTNHHAPHMPPLVDAPDDNLVRYPLTDGDPANPPPAPASASVPVTASTSIPLPPYASIEDYYAMEKGAIRQLQDPAAHAELPPTKDGYYHFGDHGTEYELQGAAPQNEQQRPHRPYRNQTAGLGRAREVDEQKVLLDDAEMAHLREQKARIRAAQQDVQCRARTGGACEMQPGVASGSQS